MKTTSSKRIAVIIVTAIVIVRLAAAFTFVLRNKADEPPKVLSSMTPQECIDFIVDRGVVIPPDFAENADLSTDIRQRIKYVASYTVTFDFYEAIKKVTNEYYGLKPVYNNDNTLAFYQ